MKTKNNTRDIAILGLFIALMAVLAFVPNIGFIPTPIGAISLVHLPVIVGTLVLGFKKGMILSLAFGIFSFIRAFTPMGIADVAFQNPLVSILPRLFIAPATYGVYKLMQKLFTGAGKRMAKYSDNITGFIGGFTGTLIGVLVIILIFFALSDEKFGMSPLLRTLIASPFGCLAGIGLYAAAKNKFKNPERSAVSFGCAAGSLANTVFTLLALFIFMHNLSLEVLLTLLSINGVLEIAVITIVGTPVTLAITGANRKKRTPVKEDSNAAGN